MKAGLPHPVLLPEKKVWHTPEDVEAYAYRCMETVGLAGWSFSWDRAARRLGCCKAQQRLISLSCHFLRHYLDRDQLLIRRIILHELAHALAWVHCGVGGHGEAWRSFCSLLGIAGEKSRCRCDDFAPASIRDRKPRYVLCHRETGEVFHRYKSRPRLSPRRLATAYIPGRKGETLGKLCIRELAQP